MPVEIVPEMAPLATDTEDRLGVAVAMVIFPALLPVLPLVAILPMFIDVPDAGRPVY